VSFSSTRLSCHLLAAVPGGGGGKQPPSSPEALGCQAEGRRRLGFHPFDTSADPVVSAHLSPCWFLPRPRDRRRWLHTLDYLSSQGVRTRGLTARSVIPQSRAQGITPGNRGTPQDAWLPAPQASQNHRILGVGRDLWGSSSLRERQSSSTARAPKSLHEVGGEEPGKLTLSFLICHLSFVKSKSPLFMGSGHPHFWAELSSPVLGCCQARGWESNTLNKALHCSPRVLPGRSTGPTPTCARTRTTPWP